jgi:hypothetical protein
MNRDLTTDDYDTLLVLDESNPKKTATEEQLQKMVVVDAEPGSHCGVCLCSFDGEAKGLPCCRAPFHEECLRKWLLDCKAKCPHCLAEL